MKFTASFAGKWPKHSFSQPLSVYDGSDAQELVDFCRAHQGKHIVGVLSYDFGLKAHGIRSKHANFNPVAIAAAFDKPEMPRPAKHSSIALSAPKFSSTRSEYVKKVEQVQTEIGLGNVYQLNLALSMTADIVAGDSESIFDLLTDQFNDNFLALLQFGQTQIISASPERFLHISDNRIETTPIKGTRPRSAGSQDELAREELLNSEKEKAELNMITDLLRNDLAGVSETGTVVVEQPRKITAHEKVWHASSLVSAQLRKDLSPIEALLQCFPGGSITGCPKFSAMQRIDNLESQARNFYTGNLFKIEPNGDLDSSILIRTLELQGDTLKIGVGSGIVADSESESEWDEAIAKSYILQSLSAKITGNA